MKELKFFRVTADYRPNNPNKPTYVYKALDYVDAKGVKKWFESVFTWLKVYNVEEISGEEYVNDPSHWKDNYTLG